MAEVQERASPAVQESNEKCTHTFQAYAGSTFANILWAKESDMTEPSVKVRGDYKVVGYGKAVNWGH